MGMSVIDLDIKNLPLEDFMKAMGFEPINRNNNLLTYESPYSTNGNIVVDTDANGWYDKAQPEKCMVEYTTSPMRLSAVPISRN